MHRAPAFRFGRAETENRLDVSVGRPSFKTGNGLWFLLFYFTVAGFEVVYRYVIFPFGSLAFLDLLAVGCYGLLGSRFPAMGLAVSEETGLEIVDAFLHFEFEGGRHQRRIDQIAQIENGEL